MARRRARKIIPRNTQSEEDETPKIYASIAAYFFSILNISLLMIIGFQTLIPTTLLLCTYVILSVSLYIYFRKKNKTRPALKAYIIGPLILNLILSLNYFISFNEYEETYHFKRVYFWDRSRINITRSPNIEMSTKIVLENNAYENYYGIRTFLSPENIGPTERITYTFKKGILGITVMTDYRFFSKKEKNN